MLIFGSGNIEYIKGCWEIFVFEDQIVLFVYVVEVDLGGWVFVFVMNWVVCCVVFEVLVNVVVVVEVFVVF